MPLTDPNEVHAYLRACQSQENLTELQGLLTERIALFEQSKAAGSVKQPFVQTLDHTGGLHQAIQVGPSPGVGAGISTAQQAAINEDNLRHQVEEGRVPGTQPAIAVVEGPSGSTAEAVRATMPAEAPKNPDTTTASPPSPPPSPATGAPTSPQTGQTPTPGAQPEQGPAGAVPGPALGQTPGPTPGTGQEGQSAVKTDTSANPGKGEQPTPKERGIIPEGTKEQGRRGR